MKIKSAISKQIKSFQDIFLPEMSIFIKTYALAFCILLLIYLVAFSAILRSGVSYVDDYGRAFEGYHGWTDWSRWTTMILATLVHAAWRLSDISPLPQLLTCLLLALAGCLLIRTFIGEKKPAFGHMIAASLFGLTPYFLGVICYKFDSPYMTVGLVASVLPFAFREKKKLAHRVVLNVLCVLIMCTSYQAYSGAFPMIALLLAADAINQGTQVKKALLQLLTDALSYLGGLLFFWLFLLRNDSVSVSSPLGLPAMVVSRYVHYLQLICSDETMLWLILDAVLILFFFLALLLSREIALWKSVLLALFVTVAESVLCFGAYLVFPEPAEDMRCMIGFPVLLALFALYTYCRKKSVIATAATLVLAWCYLTFALTVGNAMKNQQTYLDFRIGLLADSISHVEAVRTSTEPITLYIEGDIGLSPIGEQLEKTYPMIPRAVFSGLGEGHWGSYYLTHYFDLQNLEAVYEKPDGADELPLLEESTYQTIRGDETCLYITLK